MENFYAFVGGLVICSLVAVVALLICWWATATCYKFLGWLRICTEYAIHRNRFWHWMHTETVGVNPVVNEEEVDRVYEDFWQTLIETDDGELDKDRVKHELYDYHTLLECVPQVYMQVTGGEILKPNANPKAVIAAAEEYQAAINAVTIERYDDEVEELSADNKILRDAIKNLCGKIATSFTDDQLRRIATEQAAALRAAELVA